MRKPTVKEGDQRKTYFWKRKPNCSKKTFEKKKKTGTDKETYWKRKLIEKENMLKKKKPFEKMSEKNEKNPIF